MVDCQQQSLGQIKVDDVCEKDDSFRFNVSLNEKEL